MDNYYKLEEYIINNYNQKERNYEILYNIDKIINYNNIIINDINQINNETNIKDKFNYINDIYSKINYNEIKITVKIKKNEINKKIYFLEDKTDGKIVVGFKENLNSLLGFDDIKEEHHHDYIKELQLSHFLYPED